MAVVQSVVRRFSWCMLNVGGNTWDGGGGTDPTILDDVVMTSLNMTW